ncbi:hypothetical protein PENSPDRAFT_559652, partial [Peniophora sp. CONT]
LSCLLFVLAIEPLAEMLRQSDLKGVKCPNGGARLIANLFADDTTVYLHMSDSFEELTAILNRWCKASRARFNIKKTEIIPFGPKVYRDILINTRRLSSTQEPIATHIRIAQDTESSRVVGGRIGNELSDDTVWNPTLEKLIARMSFWSESGRYPDIWVRKMFTDWYHAGMTQFLASAQGMPKTIVQRVAKLQESFFWKGAKGHTINKQTLYRPRHEGGIGLTDLEARMDAITIMRI